MEQWKYLGRDDTSPNYPYDVSIYWPDPPLSDPTPIALGEGSGFMSAGGAFKLAEMLDDKWTNHLERCDCLYLRDLARQEQQEGHVFTPEEIWEKWQARHS